MRRLAPIFILVLLAGCEKNTGNEPLPPFEGARPVTASNSKWISKVLEYSPAPGQFVNDPTWGTWDAAQGLVGSAAGGLSLGGFGGYVIFTFDHTVLNGEGFDFVIHGNAFSGSSEPGVVMVSFDDNGNGLADDVWYELAGSRQSAVKGYSVTYTRPSQLSTAEAVSWSDSNHTDGAMPVVAPHGQSYWPLWASERESVTFSGTRLTGLAVQSGAFWNTLAAERGYADNYSDDYAQQVGSDADTRNSNKFDISDAVDADGAPVVLEGIDFIKVYTACNENLGLLAEMSTEVCGAISLTAGR